MNIQYPTMHIMRLQDLVHFSLKMHTLTPKHRESEREQKRERETERAACSDTDKGSDKFTIAT